MESPRKPAPCRETPSVRSAHVGERASPPLERPHRLVLRGGPSARGVAPTASPSPRWPGRRLYLGAAAFGFSALAVGRARAGTPTDLEVGGSTGAHDVHLSCGPDVRVAHASGGAHYERVFQAEGGREGTGLLVDVRAGVGTTTIESARSDNGDYAARAAAINDHEGGRHHVLATAQVNAGYDWGRFALTGGVGYYGVSELVDDSRFRARYLPLPALDMRIGRREGFSTNLGAGAAPIPGLARWYSLYAIGQYRFREGGEVGVGLLATAGELDQRSGVVFKGSAPITSRISVGGFGMIGGDSNGGTRGFGWTAGASVAVKLDED